MGKQFFHHLQSNSVYACLYCGNHLSRTNDVVSKNFHGTHGRAFLMDKCVNVYAGPMKERNLITGRHIVCDIYCMKCNKKVGWKYVDAKAKKEKYKVDRYVLEKALISTEKETWANTTTEIDESDAASSSTQSSADQEAEELRKRLLEQFRTRFLLARLTHGAAAPPTTSSTSSTSSGAASRATFLPFGGLLINLTSAAPQSTIAPQQPTTNASSSSSGPESPPSVSSNSSSPSSYGIFQGGADFYF